jgi:hypothetical protein
VVECMSTLPPSATVIGVNDDSVAHNPEEAS